MAGGHHDARPGVQLQGRKVEDGRGDFAEENDVHASGEKAFGQCGLERLGAGPYVPAHHGPAEAMLPEMGADRKPQPLHPGFVKVFSHHAANVVCAKNVAGEGRHELLPPYKDMALWPSFS